MSREPSPSGLRAVSLIAALFAITLNFLQPLALAAQIRDGAPAGAWSVFCNPNPEKPGDHSSPFAEKHECCLGLAQAPALLAPQPTIVAVARIVAALPPRLVDDTPGSFAIRDGPKKARAPPLHA
jgi:hypothetical protein